MIYHINKAVSYAKCHFSQPGSYTRIPYLQNLENQRKLHQKSANIFLGAGKSHLAGSKRKRNIIKF